MNAGCHILGEIIIGSDVQIGPKTVIWGRDHGIGREELIRKQPRVKRPIKVGNDVWIGANVTVLKGVALRYSLWVRCFFNLPALVFVMISTRNTESQRSLYW